MYFSYKFWLFYTIIIIIIQMLLFSIYNIPVFKIYCELNNYYNTNIFSTDLAGARYWLFDSLSNNISNMGSESTSYHIKLDTDLNNCLQIKKSDQFVLLDNNNNYLYIYNNWVSQVNWDYTINNSTKLGNFFYIVYFNTSITDINIVEFLSLQNNIYISPSETYLVFFRLYNPSNFVIKGISIYLISPNEISAYLYKIQCFCFDEIVIYQFESIDLPILFYLDSEVKLLNTDLFIFFQIQIIYLFILNTF